MVDTKRAIIVAVVVLLGLVAVIGMFLLQQNQSKPATLEIEFTPQSAKITVDGNPASAGKMRVSAGQHTIKASKPGFADEAKTVTVAAKETVYVGLALSSNSEDTADWYERNPDDYELFQKITGKDFSNEAAAVREKTPIIKLLPYAAEDKTYRIDYGNAENANNSQVIYVTIKSSGDRAKALAWIKERGYDPDDYTIEYITNPLLGHVPYSTPAFEISDIAFSLSTGKPQSILNVELFLSSADMRNQDQAVTRYKARVDAYIRKYGADPANYTINYTIN